MCNLFIEFQASNEFFISCSFSAPQIASTFPVRLSYFFKSSDYIFKSRYFLSYMFWGGLDFSKKQSLLLLYSVLNWITFYFGNFAPTEKLRDNKNWEIKNWEIIRIINIPYTPHQDSLIINILPYFLSLCDIYFFAEYFGSKSQMWHSIPKHFSIILQ